MVLAAELIPVLIVDRHPLFAEMLAQALAAEADMPVEVLASERERGTLARRRVVTDPSDRFAELNDFEDWLKIVPPRARSSCSATA